jgi:hypothetical protein
MLTLPAELSPLIVDLAPPFTKLVWRQSKVLLAGAILTSSKRMVTAFAHHGQELGYHFQNGIVPVGMLPCRARAKTQNLTERAWQIIHLVRRWLPNRELIFVGDSSFAVLDLLACVSSKPKASLVARH